MEGCRLRAPAAGPGFWQQLTENGLCGPHVRGVPGVCRTWKEADDDRDSRRRLDTTVKIQSLLCGAPAAPETT